MYHNKTNRLKAEHLLKKHFECRGKVREQYVFFFLFENFKSIKTFPGLIKICYFLTKQGFKNFTKPMVFFFQENCKIGTFPSTIFKTVFHNLKKFLILIDQI